MLIEKKSDKKTLLVKIGWHDILTTLLGGALILGLVLYFDAIKRGE